LVGLGAHGDIAALAGSPAAPSAEYQALFEGVLDLPPKSLDGIGDYDRFGIA
jgi:hypothetical protein